MNLCLFLITFYLFPSLISIAFCVKKCGLLWGAGGLNHLDSFPILSSYRCRGTKEFTRKWDLIQMIYEISTFPEVISLGTSYQCYEWIAHLEAFFFFKLMTISSKMWIVCLKNFINCISTHICPQCLPLGLLFTICNSIKALCFDLSSEPLLWAFM